MNDDVWILVPNWPKFQHYSDRNPPWIKLYTELNSRDDWLRLSVAERGLLTTIWIEYARTNGVVRRAKVATLCRGSARDRHWESLNRAGYIHFSASKPLAQRREEKIRERADAKPPKPRKLDDAHKANAAAYRPFEPTPLEGDPITADQLREWLGQR